MGLKRKINFVPAKSNQLAVKLQKAEIEIENTSV